MFLVQWTTKINNFLFCILHFFFFFEPFYFFFNEPIQSSNQVGMPFSEVSCNLKAQLWFVWILKSEGCVFYGFLINHVGINIFENLKFKFTPSTNPYPFDETDAVYLFIFINYNFGKWKKSIDEILKFE